jgi:DNA-binding MarR family transcriptional regulator
VALWEEDNQTVSSLGEEDVPRIQHAHADLKKLEEMGYLRRQRDPADERQVRVSLTDAGRRLREKGLGLNLLKESGLYRRRISPNCRKRSSRFATISSRRRKAPDNFQIVYSAPSGGSILCAKILH